MNLIPAIDLLAGRCVRLLHGDFDQVTHYAVDPDELAREFAAAGAKWLHVVDLAASRDGREADSSPLFDLLSAAPQCVQTGGWVRDQDDIDKRLQAGATRIVIGSLCVTESQRFIAWLKHFGADKLVAALDVQIDESGMPWPRIHGWTDQADRNLWQILDQLSAGGLVHLLCTDIGRDGALSGPNLALYSEIMKRYPQLQLQASGGVSSVADIEQLQSINVAAVITGKALLEGRFTVKQALAVLT